MSKWSEKISEKEIKQRITEDTVDFAEKFGKHLAVDDVSEYTDHNTGKPKTKVERKKLTTSQLRKFFGEVKRQQIKGFDKTEFTLLRPKLAYAVGRVADKEAKINDFNYVISEAIKLVENEDDFKRFIKIFEAIVAYHKSEEK